MSVLASEGMGLGAIGTSAWPAAASPAACSAWLRGGRPRPHQRPTGVLPAGPTTNCAAQVLRFRIHGRTFEGVVQDRLVPEISAPQRSRRRRCSGPSRHRANWPSRSAGDAGISSMSRSLGLLPPPAGADSVVGRVQRAFPVCLLTKKKQPGLERDSTTRHPAGGSGHCAMARRSQSEDCSVGNKAAAAVAEITTLDSTKRIFDG